MPYPDARALADYWMEHPPAHRILEALFVTKRPKPNHQNLSPFEEQLLALPASRSFASLPEEVRRHLAGAANA